VLLHRALRQRFSPWQQKDYQGCDGYGVGVLERQTGYAGEEATTGETCGLAGGHYNGVF